MLDMTHPDWVENAGDVLSWQGMASKRGRGQPINQFTRREEVFSACAGASLYRRSFLEDIGGFDEKFFVYLEDVDLGLRARILGYRCLFVPEAQVFHHGHGSKMPDAQYVRLVTRNRLLLFLKNVPARLIWRHLGALLYGQLYCLLVYRRPLSSLIGYGRFVPMIGYAVKSRAQLWTRAKITPEKLERLLARSSDLPPLRQKIRRILETGSQ
jgi:GT2 family glycosyltransferase